MSPARVLTSVAAVLAGFCPANGQELEGLPAPAAPREAKFAVPQEKRLENGVRVIVVERPALPLLSAALIVSSGAEADPEASSGLARFTAMLLTRGTASRGAMQIAEEAEALGGALKPTVGWDGSSVDVTTLSSQADAALALLADVVRRPAFAPPEIERLRAQTLDELRLSLEEPGTVAKLAASRVILGSGLYAHPSQGTPTSISRLRRPEIAAFHAQHYRPNRALLILAGNITAERAFALAEKQFGDWHVEDAGKAPEEARFSPAAAGRAVVIDMPGAGQAAVVLGLPGITRRADDYFPGEMANAVLGGGYSSRLNQEIRVKRGLSYGASSRLTTLRSGGLCIAACQTKNASVPEVASLMKAELAKLGSEDIPAAYLTTRQTVFAGDFGRELETNDGYITRLTDFALHDLPIDSASSYLESIRKVTGAEVRAFAQAHLAPESCSLAVAGRAKEFVKPLRALWPKTEVIAQADLDLDAPNLRKSGRGAKPAKR